MFLICFLKRVCWETPQALLNESDFGWPAFQAIHTLSGTPAFVRLFSARSMARTSVTWPSWSCSVRPSRTVALLCASPFLLSTAGYSLLFIPTGHYSRSVADLQTRGFYYLSPFGEELRPWFYSGAVYRDTTAYRKHRPRQLIWFFDVSAGLTREMPLSPLHCSVTDSHR